MKLLKLLAWVPVIGIPIEVFITFTDGPYLCDSDHAVRWWISLLWHGAWSLIACSLLFK